MNRIPFRDGILYPVARSLGYEPDRNFPPGEAAAVIDAINSRVRFAWDYWPWPETQVTEERAFRQLWSDVLGYRATLDEVYYEPTRSYFRALVDTTPGQAPTDGTKWEAIINLDRYIAYDQFGRQAIGKIMAVYALDPRAYRAASFPFTLGQSGFGIDLPLSAIGPTVWITFEPRQPFYTATVFDETHDYVRDDLVYDPETGECYRALRDSSNEARTNGYYWLMQEMPERISEYVKSGDVTTLQQQVDNLLVQGERNAYRMGASAPCRPCLGAGTGIPWLVEVPVPTA